MEDLKKAGIIPQGQQGEKKEKTQVFSDLIWAWNAFWRLGKARDVGFDRPLYIKVSEIECYARLQGYPDWKTRDLLFYVDALDDCWMSHVEARRAEDAEKRKQQQQPNNATPQPPKRRTKKG